MANSLDVARQQPGHDRHRARAQRTIFDISLIRRPESSRPLNSWTPTHQGKNCIKIWPYADQPNPSPHYTDLVPHNVAVMDPSLSCLWQFVEVPSVRPARNDLWLHRVLDLIAQTNGFPHGSHWNVHERLHNTGTSIHNSIIPIDIIT